jgi:hypothetical protein
MRFSLVSAALVGVLAAPLHAQIPDKFENLDVLPADISRNELLSVMRA